MKKNFSIPTISQYLQYLSFDSQEIFTYALFDKDSIGVIPGWGTVFGKSSDILTAVRAVPDSTLHVCLNRTGLHGRRRKDIEQCRVFCVDIDSVGKIPKCNASLIVESSPGKYHLYWQCAFSVGLEKWSAVQLALAAHYGGDFSLAETTKTIRVPGVPRRTKEGKEFLPRIVRSSGNCTVYGADNLNEVFTEGSFDEWWERGKKAKEKLQRDINRHCRDFRDNPGTTRKMLSGGGRNNALYEYVRDESRSGKVTNESQAISAARAFNKSFGEPLEDFEVEKTAISGLVRGSEAREKIQARLARYKDMLPDASENGVEENRVKVLGKQVIKKKPRGKGEAVHSFEYSYRTPYLRLNPYTENAIMERVLQRFSESLIRADGAVYAFNPTDKVWRLQDARSAPEIGHFVDVCVLDTLAEYAEEMQDAEGGEKMIHQMEGKLCSARTNTVVCKRVIESTGIRRVSLSVFDSNPDLILVKNGVLDMLSESVREPCAKDYLLVGTSIKWNAAAECPWWEEFLGQVFKNEEMRLFIQELFGYSLSGLNSEQVIFCHFGDSCNGKSKVLEALKYIAGDMASMIAPDRIVKRKGSFAPDFERFGKNIEGRRIGIVDDIDTDTIWNEGLLKGITAKSIAVRSLYKESKVVSNRCKIHMGLNTTPEPENANDAVLRRLRLIPYEEKFAARADMERVIEAKIAEEAEGILAWAVRGYQRYVAEGFTEAKKMEIALREYQESSFPLKDTIARLFSVEGANEWISVNDFMTELNQVLRYENKLEADTRLVGPLLKRMGVKRKRSIINGVKYSFYYVKRVYDVQKLKSAKLPDLL